MEFFPIKAIKFMTEKFQRQSSNEVQDTPYIPHSLHYGDSPSSAIRLRDLKQHDAFNRTWWSGLSIDKLITWQHLSIERTSGNVVLKASSCLRCLMSGKIRFHLVTCTSEIVGREMNEGRAHVRNMTWCQKGRLKMTQGDDIKTKYWLIKVQL